MPQTFHGTPTWYGGDHGILKHVLEKAQSQSMQPYEPYLGARIAPLQPLQKIATERVLKEANNPEYEEMLKGVRPLIDKAIQSPAGRVQEFLNPYQSQVIENIGKYGSRN